MPTPPSLAPSATPGAVRCEDDIPGCAGPLEAGEHGSSFFAPRLIHYVTPAGWTNSIDTPSIYKLDAPDGATSILLWTDVSIADQTPTSCEPVAKAGGVAPSAAACDLVPDVPSGSGHHDTVHRPTSLAAETNGQSIDISMDPGWTQTCPGRSEPEVMFIAHVARHRRCTASGPPPGCISSALDTTSYGERTVVIEVYGPTDDAGFSAAVELASGVMDTLRVRLWPGRRVWTL